MIQTTVGQLLVNQQLPQDMQAEGRLLDNRGMAQLLEELHAKHPDQYLKVANGLMHVGGRAARSQGSSIKMSDLEMSQELKKRRQELRDKVDLLNASNMPEEAKQNAVNQLVMSEIRPMEKQLMDEGIASGNSLAIQALSGARGNPTQYRQGLIGDMLVADHRGRTIPFPILHGYSEGLTPSEFFAAGYGARQGSISAKLSTAQSGHLGKQMAFVSHRLTVTQHDCKTGSGLPVPASDKDNDGAILAQKSGKYDAGTLITPEVRKGLGDARILVRSAATCQAPEGICSVCAGVREKGRLPGIGDQVGIASSQAVGEKIAQGSLSQKHTGGTVSKEKHPRSGFAYINRMLQAPKVFPEAAVVASEDGRISDIREAPQGGNYVKVGALDHYVPAGIDLRVKVGDQVEAGDPLNEGAVNPSDAVQYKGLGEGRRLFIETFKKALDDSDVRSHRRNIEVLSRGIQNHARITNSDRVEGTLPDDLVTFDQLARAYKPSETVQSVKTHEAVGRYLVKPAAHYSLGTRITPRVANDLKSLGVESVDADTEHPGFEPEMVRAMEHGLRDPNPLTRMAGSYLEKGLLDTVHRARTAPRHDTSYVASLINPEEFGKDLETTGKY